MTTFWICERCGRCGAVCTCACRYPYVLLCEEHFEKSHQSPGGFQHFRLPVEAGRYIQSEESHARYEKWFFGLDKAHKMLRKHCEDFDHFEQRIDAACQDIVAEFTRFTESVKEKIRGTKKLFAEKVEEAISETTLHCIEPWATQHCIEPWTPPEDSLSSLIWNFAHGNPVSLKVFQLSVEAKSIDQTFSVNLKPSLPTLSGFQTGSDREGRQPLSAVLATDDALRKESKFQESYELLQQRLREADRETVRLRLAQCEVAVHLGNFQEAQEVLDKAIPIADLSSPEDLPELHWARALVHFHKGEFLETVTICSDVARRYRPSKIPEDIFLIHVLSLNKSDFGSSENVFDRFLELYGNPPPIAILLDQAASQYRRDFASAQENTRNLMQTFQRPSTSIYYSMVVAHLLIPSVRKTEQYQSLKQLICQHFPRSFWYAETLAMLSDSLTASSKYEAARDELKEATEFLSQYFPRHSFSAYACTMLASTCLLAGRAKEALDYCLQAKALFEHLDSRQGRIGEFISTLTKIERRARTLV